MTARSAWLICVAFWLITIVRCLRTNVVITGTTSSPDFHREEGYLALSCPDTHPYALNNGLSCCKYYKRKFVSGDSTFDGTELKYEDNRQLCQNDDIMDMALHETQRGRRYRDNSEVAGFATGSSLIECPSDHPFAFNRGQTCCKDFKAKVSNDLCKHATLDYKDPVHCCQGGIKNCNSAQFRCKDHTDSDKFCPAMPAYHRKGKLGYKLIDDTVTRTHTENLYLCTTLGAVSPMFKNRDDVVGAWEFWEELGNPGGFTIGMTMLDGFGACGDAQDCSGKRHWADGTPVIHHSWDKYLFMGGAHSTKCYYYIRDVDAAINRVWENYCYYVGLYAVCQVEC